MLGLDVTHKADIRAGLCGVLEQGNAIAVAAAQMARGYAESDPFLHDPCVIAYLVRPDIFQAPTDTLKLSMNRAGFSASAMPLCRMCRKALKTSAVSMNHISIPRLSPMYRRTC